MFFGLERPAFAGEARIPVHEIYAGTAPSISDVRPAQSQTENWNEARRVAQIAENMNTREIDVDLGTALAVQTAKEHITDQAEKLAFEAGLSGNDFDNAVATTVACKQPSVDVRPDDPHLACRWWQRSHFVQRGWNGQAMTGRIIEGGRGYFWLVHDEGRTYFHMQDARASRYRDVHEGDVFDSMLRSNEAVKGVPSTFDGLSELAPTGGHRFRHIASVAHRCCPIQAFLPIQKLRVIFATTTNSAGARPC